MKGKKEHFCRACKAPVEHSASAQGSIFVLCPTHAAAVSFDRRVRAVLDAVAWDVERERVVVVHDADGVGWGHPVPLKPPPKGVPLIQDDGSPTFRDWDPTAIVGGEDDGQV
jgi:hypothetical protein